MEDKEKKAGAGLSGAGAGSPAPVYDLFDVMKGVTEEVALGNMAGIPGWIERADGAKRAMAVAHGCSQAIHDNKPKAVETLLLCLPPGPGRKGAAARAMEWASTSCRLECVEAAARAEPSVLLDPEASQAAALAAANVGHLEGVAWVAAHCARLDWSDPRLAEMGCRAADRGTEEQLRAFLAAGMDPNGVGEDGATPLTRAVTSGRPDSCVALLAAGADILFSAQGTGKPCALLYAAVNSSSSERDACWTLARAALERMDPAAWVHGAEAIRALGQLAMQGGSQAAEAVAMLLGKGMDPNKKNEDGRTALMNAALGSQQKPGSAMLVALMAAGADPALKDDRGWDAVRLARDEHRSSGVAEWLEAASLAASLARECPEERPAKGPLRM